MAHLLYQTPYAVSHQLQNQLLGRAALQWLGFVAILVGLSRMGLSPVALFSGGLSSALVLTYVQWLWWNHLVDHRPPDNGRPYARLGAANQITLFRGWLISVLGGFAFWVEPAEPLAHGLVWVPAVIYLVIGAADFLDGLVARRGHIESVLGARMDIAMDALGLLVASLVAVALKRLPAVYLLVGMAYYIFRLALRRRQAQGKPVRPLEDRPYARAIAGIHMGFVGLALMPIFATLLLGQAAILFMLPLLAGFAWDWLIVSSRLRPQRANGLRQVVHKASTFLAGSARLFLLAVGLPVTQQLLAAGPVQGYAFITLWAMMVIGCSGRLAAIAAAVLLAAVWPIGPASMLPLLAFNSTLIIIMTGTGRWSVFQPEDHLFYNKVS